LHLKCGKLEITAYGIPAVAAVLIVIVALGRFWTAW
jgi:hypothetical protein